MATFTHDFANGIEQFDSKIGIDLAHKTNDTLYEVAKRYPRRVMGYVAPVSCNPKAAVDVLQRMVMELGFKEWNTHSNYGDTVVDDPAYHPILEKAEELGVPVSIHPTVPAFAQ